MTAIAKKLNKLKEDFEENLQNEIETFLMKEFIENGFFTKYPELKSLKINAYQHYNDSDYSTYVGTESESIAINGVAYNDLDESNDNKYLENEEEISDAASEIFSKIPDEIYTTAYGTDFGIKVTPTEIVIENSDIQEY